MPPNFKNNSVRRRANAEYRKAMRRIEQGDSVGKVYSLGLSHARSMFIQRRRQAGADIPNRADRRRALALRNWLARDV